MNDHHTIPLPSATEKNLSIQLILTHGLPPPQRLSAALPALCRTLGLRGLFCGVSDCILLALATTALLWCGLLTALISSLDGLYILLFGLSPLLYGLLHLLSMWKEILLGTYEQLMTCRCSLRQLTVLRMLLFGALSLVLSVAVIIGIWLIFAQELSILRMLSLSFSGLFLFAALQLIAEWRWSAPWVSLIVPICWSGGILLLLSTVCRL